MASSDSDSQINNYLKAALRHLKLNSEAELKREFLLKPVFFKPWRKYRDNCLWSPDATGRKGLTMKTSIDEAVGEIKKGLGSLYIPAFDTAMDTSGFDERNHMLYLIVSVAHCLAREQSIVSVHEDTESFVKGIMTLVRLLRYQYLPSNGGRLVKELDEATGQSVHKHSQTVFRNQQVTPQTAELELPRAAFQVGPNGANFAYKPRTGDMVRIPLVKVDEDPRAPQSDLPSGNPEATSAEQQQRFTESVDSPEDGPDTGDAEREAKRRKT